MTDIIDAANDRAELDLALALKRAAAHEPELAYIGACHNCDASLPEPQHFCGKECRDDYERRQRAARLK